jgi:repressor LexA
MPVTLYKRQKQILKFIKDYIEKYGYSPTLGEIAEAMGVSSLATVHEHVQALAKKGVIKKFDGSVRGIEVTDAAYSTPRTIELPVLGFIAAGQPIMPFTDPGATIGVSPSYISDKKRSYVLQVKGKSMIEDHIDDGDYVVIQETQEVSNGDIVVALLDTGLATLKRYYKEVTRVRLEPANLRISPTTFPWIWTFVA